MNDIVYNIIIVIAVLGLWLVLISLALRGWRNRGRRQQSVIGAFPSVPADLGAPVLGPDTGLYVGSTLAPDWNNRVAVGDYGDRATTEFTGYDSGILLDRRGAAPIWIPREAIVAVRTESAHAGKVMTAGGLLVIRWTLPSGTEIDSGLRADAKEVYSQWVSTYDPQPSEHSPPRGGTPDEAASRGDTHNDNEPQSSTQETE